MKTCNVCKKELPFTEFGKNKASKDGYLYMCKSCKRNKMLMFYYNITTEEYNEMLKTQNYKCSICSITIDKSGPNGLCVDHDHTTGKIRELLCSHCNTSLGMMKEDVGLLEKMILYIKKHNTSP